MNTSKQDQKKDNFSKMFDSLENEKTEFTELTQGRKYLKLDEFETEETRPFICLEMTTFTKDGEDKPAVILMDKSREEFICASTVIVNAFSKVKELPVGCKIQVMGKKDGPNGSYFDVKVFIL